MKKKPFLEYVMIDFYSSTPKYLQLANGIIKAISDGNLKKGDIIPSINELSFEFEIARDTAEKGYKHLKQMGILGSVPGKGYFIKNDLPDSQLKILLLFNKLSPHKKIVYDAFVSKIGSLAAIDFYIYNNVYHLYVDCLKFYNIHNRYCFALS